MNQLNNPLWPFAIHNGERTIASKSLLQSSDYIISFERKRVSDEELRRCKVLKYKNGTFVELNNQKESLL